MPVQENEIALDTITLDKMGLPYELGQEITLQWRKDLNGEEITTSTFTLSGYWDGNSAAMASMAWVSEAFVQSQCAGMAIVADIPTITEGVNSSTQDFLSFYLPTDTFRAMYPDNTMRKMFFDVAEEYQPQAEEMLIDYRDNVDKSLNYTAKSTLIEHYQEQTRANTVMGFAISLIIAFVGILNFINSMLTAIVSRQKEFAMIQSIGMTKRQLRSMLIDEGLYYAGSTLLASYVLGALAVRIGVRMMVSTDWTATFHFTLLPLVICTPILIVFAILISYICFKNLEKQSIVERLRATD